MKTILFAILLAIATTATAQTVERYINTYAPLAQEISQQYGIPASVVLSQAICAGFGQQPLAASNNHFGYNVKPYASVKNCYTDYAETVRRIVGDMPKNSTVEQWAEAISKSPLFSELGYANTVIETLYQWNLKRFD